MEAAAETMTRGGPSSALELFHPAGTASSVQVLGGACPPSLLGSLTPSHETADLVVVAPTEAECRATGWLERAARAAGAALADDGVAFLIAPRRWRSRLVAAARAEGLQVGPTLLHLPNLGSSRHVVPADRAALRYATESILPRSSRKSMVASVVLRLPLAERLVAYAAPASVVARRRSDPRLLEWLSGAAGESVRVDKTIVTPTWRPTKSTFTVAVVDTAGPRLIARVGRGPDAARPEFGEARALGAFATTAEQAGAMVPRVLASSELAGVPLLIETGVGGRLAGVALAERPGEVGAVLDRTLAWLLRWNRLTAAESVLTAEYLEQELFRPARAVAPSLATGAAYLASLERLRSEVTGRRTTLTAAHDDLTMVNVLLRADGGLGVVDWGTARHAALPLVDFFYAVVDAYAAAERYADRPLAFARCFANGAHPPAVRAHQSRFQEALGIEPDVARLAFHACWLHHAANELARDETGGPFLAIVSLLAGEPERFRP